jgi:hypothetical protein
LDRQIKLPNLEIALKHKMNVNRKFDASISRAGILKDRMIIYALEI